VHFFDQNNVRADAEQTRHSTATPLDNTRGGHFFTGKRWCRFRVGSRVPGIDYFTATVCRMFCPYDWLRSFVPLFFKKNLAFMRTLDWLVLLGTLAFVIFYGIWQGQKKAKDAQAHEFLAGQRTLPWWTIGLSIMATQASAITFLSTPGQGFADGMQFVQFYFGMPFAMLILAYFVLPIYYRLRVTTAYEYLEERFDLRMRSLTAVLFLVQRGVAAAISIYAPSIILCAVFGWDLALTNFLMAVFVVIYTTSGGSNAVSRTQELQMTIMLSGLVLAFVLILNRLPDGVGLTEAWQVAGVTDKTQVIDLGIRTADDGTRYFDWQDRYNLFSGLLGALFLFLSYFGTDQSQVGRYLSGKSLRESRFGLLFNGFVKIPMQFLVLSVGVMLYVFYQYNAPPLYFNSEKTEKLRGTPAEAEYTRLQQRADSIFQEKQNTLAAFNTAAQANDAVAKNLAAEQLRQQRTTLDHVRFEGKELLFRAQPNPDTAITNLKTTNPGKYRKEVEKAMKDTDYVFISYILRYIPTGLVGLLIAMIFCASWSTTASELNALTATSVSDIYRRSLVRGRDEAHYLRASKWATVLWGAFIVVFATYADLFDNLIQAVNMVGSLFYGTILGIFFTAFFLKKVRGTAVFWAAVVAQSVVAYLFFEVNRDAYLWYNPLGCGLVMGISLILQYVLRGSQRQAA
jgi:solute:Na+ symporter, SSS family